MKTIALNESTFSLLEDLKRKERASSFDQLVKELIAKEKKLPKSMFGAVKKIKTFTKKERKKLWKDTERIK